MGCQCQKPEFLNDELTADEKKQIKNIEADNDYLSNNNNYYFKNKYIDQMVNQKINSANIFLIK